MLANLWRKVAKFRTQPAKRQPQCSRPALCVELLEDRCLLSAVIAEFPVSAASSSPFGITTGPDGNIWFTESQANQIGMSNPLTHAIAGYPIPTASSAPSAIAVGPDGNLWFTEATGNQIGTINPTTHIIHEFPVPTANSQLTGITAGPDGNLWFTETAANQVGMINPTTHDVAEGLVPTANSSPTLITAGPDGNLWFTENNTSKIATINPITHVITEYPTPSANSQPYGITIGPDGNIWFTETHTNRIVRVNPTTHAIIEFPIPARTSAPFWITAGADGNLWFVENNANQIGSINPMTGVVTETAIPTASSFPTGITAGPGGVLWFAETNANQIGQVVAAPVVTTAPTSQSVHSGQTVTFTAAATGLPVPTVLWQVSTNGGPIFTPLTNGGVYSGVYSGISTGTLTITGATTAMTGYRYEAVFSNGIGPAVTTAPATLTVTSVLGIMPELPGGIVGTSYDQTVSMIGSTTPFTLFAVNSFNAGGTGLTLSDITTNSVNGTIAISGTPTAAGTAAFTIAVANVGGDTLSQIMHITIRPPLTIDTPSLPQATAGSNYHQAITVLGGVMPYMTFAVTNFSAGGTGLTAPQITKLPATGVFNINGTPTAAGTATFTVNVADSAGTALSKVYTITVNPALTITPALSQGTAGTIYHQTVTVNGGGMPYATLTASNFVPGTTGLTVGALTANAAAGTITINGTPTAAGAATFLAHVVDADGAVLNKTYTITINPALTITPFIPQGTAGASYHRTITVAGGSKPYTTFTISGFSAGATGLTAGALVVNAAAGTIAINGRPSAAGTASFTVNVADTAGSSLTKAFTITINAAPTFSSFTTTQWTAGKTGFTGTITISGGAGPFSIAGFTGLPTVFTAVVKGAVISFTRAPTAAGTFGGGQVTIHDAAGATATKTFGITINPAPTVGNLSLTQWTAGQPGFNGVMTVAGGTGGLSVVSTHGVPTGLAIVLNGNTLSSTGTPMSPAPPFLMGAGWANLLGSVMLRDAIGATVTKTFAITINLPPTIGNLTATQWTAGKAGFTGVMTIAAGTGPFTITNSSGLPAGLSAIVTGNTIHFTGTPSAAQTFAAGSVSIRDAVGATFTKAFSITINPPLAFATIALPATKMALMYTAPLQTTGGTGPVTFTLTAGSLPPGMKLASNGIISGVSRGFGSFTFTITATDAIGTTVSKAYTLLLAFR
ncbi:MAG: hypothetical protein EXR98_06955 [Gemmataceae bacterium]|nr:hypothetical protein [Gemmataceae bacterium]